MENAVRKRLIGDFVENLSYLEQVHIKGNRILEKEEEDRLKEKMDLFCENVARPDERNLVRIDIMFAVTKKDILERLLSNRMIRGNRRD